MYISKKCSISRSLTCCDDLRQRWWNHQTKNILFVLTQDFPVKIESFIPSWHPSYFGFVQLFHSVFFISIESAALDKANDIWPLSETYIAMSLLLRSHWHHYWSFIGFQIGFNFCKMFNTVMRWYVAVPGKCTGPVFQTIPLITFFMAWFGKCDTARRSDEIVLLRKDHVKSLWTYYIMQNSR